MSNTRCGRIFARSLNRHCGHGAYFFSDGACTMDKQCPWSAGAKRCPDIFRQACSDCAIANFAVRVETFVEISEIVFCQQHDQYYVGVCCRCKIFQHNGVVLLHLGEQHRIGLCGYQIGCIPLGLWSSGWSSGLLKRSYKVTFETAPGLLKTRFLGPFLTIILIYPSFFDVCVRHGDNLSRCIQILHCKCFLIPLNLIDEIVKVGLAWIGSFIFRSISWM